MSQNRLSNLYALMEEARLDAVALNPGPTLAYLTGLSFHLSERPTVLLVARGKDPLLVLPQFEQGKADLSSTPLHCAPYSDDPSTWKSAFKDAFESIGLDHARIGVEPTRLRVLELDHLKAGLSGADFISAEKSLGMLRIHKDAAEIEAMRTAARIAEQALQNLLPQLKPGMSEKEIESELTVQLLRAGAASELPFTPIVASGPNSANPHATPGERCIQSGDLLLFDWGASSGGYCSDITRTFAIGEPDPELKVIARVVQDANNAAFAAAAPGVPAGLVDQAARAVIESAGYGVYFNHRTGHGLGMEGHEAPYIYAENELELQSGMSFTIEPGIYLPGRGGVRIEDDVFITKNGAERLTSLPRELVILN